jgi:hypothetical protein
MPWRTQQLRLVSDASCNHNDWLLGLLLLFALTALITAAFLFIVIRFVFLQAVQHV